MNNTQPQSGDPFPSAQGITEDFEAFIDSDEGQLALSQMLRAHRDGSRSLASAREVARYLLSAGAGIAIDRYNQSMKAVSEIINKTP